VRTRPEACPPGYYVRVIAAAYHTFRVPPALEISARPDWPAFGMSGANIDGSKTEPWMQTHARDMFVATVPRRGGDAGNIRCPELATGRVVSAGVMERGRVDYFGR
jgi:hypothetical protein